MRIMRHLAPVLVVGVLAGTVGVAPQPPSTDPNVVFVAGPPKGSKDGGGRIAGAAKNDGAVNGTGTQRGSAKIGEK